MGSYRRGRDSGINIRPRMVVPRELGRPTPRILWPSFYFPAAFFVVLTVSAFDGRPRPLFCEGGGAEAVLGRFSFGAETGAGAGASIALTVLEPSHLLTSAGSYLTLLPIRMYGGCREGAVVLTRLTVRTLCFKNSARSVSSHSFSIFFPRGVRCQ